MVATEAGPDHRAISYGRGSKHRRVGLIDAWRGRGTPGVIDHTSMLIQSTIQITSTQPHKTASFPQARSLGSQGDATDYVPYFYFDHIDCSLWRLCKLADIDALDQGHPLGCRLRQVPSDTDVEVGGAVLQGGRLVLVGLWRGHVALHRPVALTTDI